MKLPIYTIVENGPCHKPRFTATVTVQDQVFQTPDEFKSVKEAQNAAARMAYDHFNVPSPVAAPATVNSQFQNAAPVAPPEMQPDFDLLLPSPLPSSLPSPPPGNYLLLYFPEFSFYYFFVCLCSPCGN